MAVQHSLSDASTLRVPMLYTGYHGEQGRSEDKENGGGVNLAVL